MALLPTSYAQEVKSREQKCVANFAVSFMETRAKAFRLVWLAQKSTHNTIKVRVRRQVLYGTRHCMHVKQARQ